MRRGSEEELVVAGLAVHLAAALADSALVQQAQAVGAGEVLGVVLAPRSCDAAAGDRAAAALADAALALVEVLLAVGPPLQLEEGAAAEAAQAVLRERDGGGWHGCRDTLAPVASPGPARTHRAHEALRVPDPTQG